jgi:molybdate/tungstate transport system substrate-binding protein
VLDSDNTLRIIHAGALERVVQKCLEHFSKQYPEYSFEFTAVGSREGAKRLLLGEEYDIIALADQALFAELLVPVLVESYFVFAADQIVLSYNCSSKGSRKITPENWPEILLKPQIRFARSNHHLDPCGYRTLMVWQLAEIFFAKPGLCSALEAAAIPYFTYPKSLDLAAALSKGQIDYAFLYSSQAKQLGLPYIALPAKINLSNPAYANFYDQAVVSVDSITPGENVIIHGRPIEFAVGIAKASKLPVLAKLFINFLMDLEGNSILEECGFIPC